MADFVTQIGESYVGTGAEAAHVNTVLGSKGGPVETAWATALATPRSGHSAFVTVIRPGLPVKPLTLFVNKATIADDAHAKLTWGAAQAGVASGVLWGVSDATISEHEVDSLLLIAAIWVDPEARDEDLVYENNQHATKYALEAGLRCDPPMTKLLDARATPWNPFFREVRQ